MPEISRFLGIVIKMYFREHGPPHFHAEYGDERITVRIDTGEVVGTFPPRALAHVREWFDLHRAELADDWARAARRAPLQKIAPLECR